MFRIIGIRHRVKKTVEGESRPTMVAILDGVDKTRILELPTETDERDFVLGKFPVEYRQVLSGEGDEILEGIPRHQFKFRPLAEGEDVLTLPKAFVEPDGKKPLVVDKIPVRFEGLRQGDEVAMILGGSGNMLAYAIARRAEKIGGKLARIPPFVFKDKRGEASKDEDHILLAQLYSARRDFFYEIRPRDKNLIIASERFRARQAAMKNRIACEQRIGQLAIGKLFASDDLSPEATVEKMFDQLKSQSPSLAAIQAEEDEAWKEMATSVGNLPIYQRLHAQVEGAGPRILAGLIVAIMDIRSFATKAKLRAFCGVHVLEDGTTPRRRKGVVSNWNPEARQALYQLGLQFVRKPGSVWGAKLLEYKAKTKAAHPEEVIVVMPGKNGKTYKKKMYTKGHIHSMAIWKTLNCFVSWLWKDWWMTEGKEFPPTLPPAIIHEPVVLVS